MLLDTEHSPTGPKDVFDQLLALDRSDHTTPIVRPPWNDSVEFKKLLDIGARTLLVPYVSTVEEAEAAVARVRRIARNQKRCCTKRAAACSRARAAMEAK